MSPSEFRRIIRQAQRPILDIIDKGAVAGGGLAFDFGPFLVGHEGGPARLQRLGVGPFQQVDEFELSLGTRLPHGADVEAVAGHDADGMRSEEHTSELQSLMRISYAVFCLKKKKNTTHTEDKK